MHNNSKKNIAFLFGAGVSIPSGLPNTEELTEKIITGENKIETVESYSCILENEYIIRVKKLFHILENNLGDHYSFINRKINYEDYYYMVDSLHTNENMEFENPLVEYFRNYLSKAHTSIFEPLSGLTSNIRLIDLMSKAKDYIRCSVSSYLNIEPSSLSQFEILNEINKDPGYSNAYIFTLNHDLLIEQYFHKSKITFSDGFEEHSDARIWNPKSFKNKTHLIKLHGSINWHYYNSDDPYQKKVCIYHKLPRDVLAPVIIIGSFNKLGEYSRGINFELQCHFAKYLNECDNLIISGYSFGDQGINSRIINWLFRRPGRKIVVIHKNEEELFSNSRNAIRTIWSNDQKDNTDLIRIIPKWFEETNWEEIKSKLN